MAHNLYRNARTGKYAFMSVQQPAWHGLGTIVNDYPTSSEAIVLAGLDYEVIKNPLHTDFTGMIAGPDGLESRTTKLIVPDTYATINSENMEVLGTVGADYQIVQNRDAFSFFDSIISEGKGVKYETAGALGKGGRIFITATLPDTMVIGKDDEIKKYLFLTTSHDGSGSITVAFTPTRIVCANTLNAALGNMSNSIKIRHTSGAKDRLEKAHKVMGLCANRAAEMTQVYNRMSSVEITDQEVFDLIRMAMAPNKETVANLRIGNEDELSTVFKNTCDDVFGYAMEHHTQTTATTQNTLYGVYNAVTGYYQNGKKYTSAEEKTKAILLDGTAQKRGQAAFDLCQMVLEAGDVATVLN